MTEPTANYKMKTTIDLLEGLRANGEQRLSKDEIDNIVNTVTEGHFWPGLHLHPAMTFYRARKLSDNTAFRELDQLLALPAELVKSAGRCHSPGQSVLYASTNLETICAEIGATIGDKIQILEFCPTNETLKAAIIGEVDHTRRYGKPIFFPDILQEQIAASLADLSEIERLRFNYTDAFFAEKFRSPVKYEHEYKITASFTKLIFSQGVDAVFYPSVAHLGGLNIAIKGELFENHLTVISSKIIEVKDSLGFGFYSIPTLTASSSIDNGKITFPDTDLIPLYEDFSSFIWANRYPCGGPLKLLNIMFLKFNSEAGEFELIPMNGVVPLSNVAGLRLSMSLTFKEIIESGDNDFPGWELVWVETVGCIDNDDAITKAQTVKERISQNSSNGTFFTRNELNMPSPDLELLKKEKELQLKQDS